MADGSAYGIEPTTPLPDPDELVTLVRRMEDEIVKKRPGQP